MEIVHFANGQQFLSFKYSINLDVVTLSGDDYNTKISMVCVWGFRGSEERTEAQGLWGWAVFQGSFVVHTERSCHLSSLKKTLLVVMNILIDLN